MLDSAFALHSPISPSSQHHALSLPPFCDTVSPILDIQDASCSQLDRAYRPRDAPARLLSPFRPSERLSTSSCSGTSLQSCGVPKRRRSQNMRPRSNARPHQCKHAAECAFPVRGPAIFDELPWVSMLEQTPSSSWDVADLSLLPVEKRRAQSHSSRKAGPIRSRKSSLRTAPFPAEPGVATPELSPSLSIDSPLPELILTPSRWNSIDDDVPRTPPQRVSVLPIEVTFRNLMPVSLSDADISEPWWQEGF